MALLLQEADSARASNFRPNLTQCMDRLLIASEFGAGFGPQLRPVPCDWPYRRQPQPAGAALARSHKRHPVLALREPLSRGIARRHDEMPKFELSDKEIDTIIAYINSLSP